VTTTLAQHPLAWDEVDDGTAGNTLRWYDDDQPDGMHESVTYEDLGHVGLGLGATTVPPNRGWDFL
jgi:hypothetical protein